MWVRTWVCMGGVPTMVITATRPQIAKDMKQFYDQAAQQTMVDDKDMASKAQAVMKTFHQTVGPGVGVWGGEWGPADPDPS